MEDTQVAVSREKMGTGTKVALGTLAAAVATGIGFGIKSIISKKKAEQADSMEELSNVDENKG